MYLVTEEEMAIVKQALGLVKDYIDYPHTHKGTTQIEKANTKAREAIKSFEKVTDGDPSEQWQKLKKVTIENIEKIDSITPWANREPQWWLEMMDVEKLLIKNE